MITAGHNVFTWKAGGGRARQIVAYAGYNSASNINDPSVEVRKAKRVVTTSQWLSNRGSMAHDFAMVMFDKPFTNVTPFQYIETPVKDKLELGVVGYPADKIDATTGERGGRMYELFENTAYNTMEQKDTMLEHFIDSEGGNSGGPVLRGSDLCAIATHVYGGDSNTASVLGRYGNPVQDYIAAFDLPLANPGQINLVPVSGDIISQADAATGLQAKEIAKLGDNVLTPASDLKGHNDGFNGTKPNPNPNKPEFWIFEGVDEILSLTKDVATTLGPTIGGAVGAVIVPAIVAGIKTAQPEGAFEIDAALRRALLANSTFLVAQQRNTKEEGWLDDLTDVVTAPLKLIPNPITPIPAVGSPVIRLPFEEVMRTIGVVGDAAEKLINDVAAEITRGLLLRAQIPELARLAKAESAMDVDSAAKANENEAAFVRQLAQAAAHRTTASEEGFFDDVGDFFKGAVDSVGEVVSDGAKLVGKATLDGVGLVVDTITDVTDTVSKVPVVGDVFGTVIRGDPAFRMLQMVGKTAKEIKFESAFDDEDKPENVFDDLRREVSKISQALVLHQVFADQFLSAQMARPVAQLKEEGFFDDVGDFFSNGKNLQAVGAGISCAGAVAPVIPVVGPILGLGLLGLGGVTTVVGMAI
ncbi:hypothetical protein F5Y06DRAFT_256469 [Hypoxylon sp. FL0890]|nr:hypothetical protein F5Y06DRAFT_256469 [Hypoxylon sp. FL0890]